MGQALLWLSIVGMGALWCGAFVSSRRQSRVGTQLIFALGLLVVWPALTLGLGGEIFDAAFPAGKPVGLAGAIIFLIASGLALAMWLVGFWFARIVGYFARRKHAEA
jgi:hypothetical protein